MRKLYGAILLLAVAATQAVAQADFSNQYLLKLSGGASYGGDLSLSCGSRFDVNVVYEDGHSELVYTQQHGGLGLRTFNLEIVFNSTNKVKRIVTWGRAYRKSGLSSCRRIGEGEGDFDVDLTTSSCFARTFTGAFVGYDAAQSTVSVDIQPLSKGSMKLAISSNLRNNANQEYANDPRILPRPEGPTLDTYKQDFNYSIVTAFQDGTTDVHNEHLDIFDANQTASKQWVVNYAGRKQVSSVSVSGTGTTSITAWNIDGQQYVDTFFLPTFYRQFPASDMTVPDSRSFTYTAFPGAAASDVSVSTSSYSFPIKYGPDNTNILPYGPNNRVTILGPAGNATSFYHWVYSLDGTTWKDFPAQFQGKSRLSLSGYDLEGEAFMDHPVANRFIKLIVDCNGGESETLVLSGRISAPNITSITGMPDRCYDTPWDGAFKITFSRALLDDGNGNRERLTILVRDLALSNANAPDQVIDVTLDAQNSYTWPRRLQSDKQYEVTLLDTYLGTFGYTGDLQNHYAHVQLTRPSPVSSVVTPQAVHCYAGSDGQINLTAQGGAGNYHYDFTKVETGEVTIVSMGADVSSAIPFLPAGSYLVKVYDGNNCGDKDGEKSLAITQPAKALAISYTAVTDPRGFGYEDGYIETILTGGTPLADNAYTLEWYNPTNLLPATLQNNGPLAEGYQANLDSIGDGYYKMRAYDSQYALAHPDHRAGCFVESELFHVVEPPPIVVTVSQYHFVTCNGYDDGEIMARANGGVKLATGALPYRYDWLLMVNGVPTPISQSDSIATELRAGEYRIRITDKNNVQKLSEVFVLVQPDLLQAQVTGTPIRCNLGMDGTASAAVQGGTAPYAYEWSEGSLTPQIGNLAAGTYFVFVTDVRGCTTTTSGKVATPFPLQIDSVLRAPQCFGYSNGGIDLSITAGTAPYRYEWSNGAVTQDLDGLTQGTYSVIITDGNDCKSYRSYTLEDPAAVIIDLGKERFLCNDQSYEADVTLSEPARYAWTGPNGFTASTGTVTLNEEGTYHVIVTDMHECRGEDDLVLKKVALDLDAEFFVSTQAFVSEEVTLLNISSTPSDSVQWWTSSPTTTSFTGKASNKALMVFANEGVFTLYMKTFRQGCEALFSKPITVLGTSFSTPPQETQSIIQDFSVAPNPSRGAFTVMVSLQEASSIRLRLMSVGDNRIISEIEQQGSSEYEIPYSVNLAAGTYLLLLETSKGSDLRKVLIY